MSGKKYDFIDFGAREGGSLRMASQAFGGVGLGVDIDPENIEILRSKGYDGLLADATNLPLEDNSVKFSQALHFIEHLPNKIVAENVIDAAVRVSRDFFLGLGPDFGGKQYLAELGLKKYFADWTGHTFCHTAEDIRRILAKYEHYKWTLIQFDPILDSNSPVLIRVSAPPNQKRFDPTTQPPKPAAVFKPKIFEHLAFVVLKTDRFSVEEILFRAMKPKVVAESGQTPLYERNR